jgi:DNA invertase Pin-like site-specific DNA recombinase
MTTKPRRVARYLRVSTDGQSTALQRRDLIEAQSQGMGANQILTLAGR